MRGHWLKAIGHARGPLGEGWLEERPELLRRTGFPRRPRIVPGDRLVYYASVWRRVFAVVEAVGDPEPHEHPRWPWIVAVEPLLVVPVLDAGRGPQRGLEGAGLLHQPLTLVGVRAPDAQGLASRFVAGVEPARKANPLSCRNGRGGQG